MSQYFCAICGKFVDKSLSQYEPMSAEVDHIIPIAKGGHPSAIDNLQLTHKICNQRKSDKVTKNQVQVEPTVKPLQWSLNWFEFRM